MDECAGLDGLMTYRVHKAMGQPVENTLHDVRWGDADRSGTVQRLRLGVPDHRLGAAGAFRRRLGRRHQRAPAGDVFPPRRRHAQGHLQARRDRLVAIFVEDGRLKMDLGRAGVVELPPAETERRWQATTPQWPIMHAVTYGVTRDQMMAKHKANHIQVAYANSAEEADKAMLAKAAMAEAMGMKVNLCGTKKNGKGWDMSCGGAGCLVRY